MDRLTNNSISFPHFTQWTRHAWALSSAAALLSTLFYILNREKTTTTSYFGIIYWTEPNKKWCARDTGKQNWNLNPGLSKNEIWSEFNVKRKKLHAHTIQSILSTQFKRNCTSCEIWSDFLFCLQFNFESSSNGNNNVCYNTPDKTTRFWREIFNNNKKCQWRQTITSNFSGWLLPHKEQPCKLICQLDFFCIFGL